MTSQFLLIWHHRQFFWRCFVSLVKFRNWSKFHVITSSGVMTIFFYKRLIKNPEIGNTRILVLSNICRLGQVRDVKFGINGSNKISMNDAKCQGYSFYHFWVINVKPTGGKITPTPSRLSNIYGEYCDMKLKANILQIPDGLQWGVISFIQQGTPLYKKFQC